MVDCELVWWVWHTPTRHHLIHHFLNEWGESPRKWYSWVHIVSLIVELISIVTDLPVLEVGVAGGVERGHELVFLGRCDEVFKECGNIEGRGGSAAVLTDWGSG